jgi:DNA invertase Pin-like site-specific DNA recombinase
LTDRQGLKLALEVLREGDTLVVWKLDRLGRGLKLCLEKTKKDNGWQKTCPARHNMVLDF